MPAPRLGVSHGGSRTWPIFSQHTAWTWPRPRAITPNNSVVFDQPTRAIYVGGGGTVEVETLWGGTVTFEGVAAGAILPIRALRVLSGTSAAFLIGLY